jgi:hypothetical protein
VAGTALVRRAQGCCSWCERELAETRLVNRGGSAHPASSSKNVRPGEVRFRRWFFFALQRRTPISLSPISDSTYTLVCRGCREEDGGIVLWTCRKFLHRSFGARAFCSCFSALDRIVQPCCCCCQLPAGPREHALLLSALHASRHEGKQGLRRRFVRQLRQKELANG